MKSNYSYLTIFLLVLCAILSACARQDTESSGEIPSISTGDLVLPPGDSDLSNLGLTDEEIKMLEDRGVANVESVEVASKIAGFTVAVPSYVPNGFTPGKFMINISGAGMPSGMSMKFNNTKVERVYIHGDKQFVIVLTQSTQKFGIGGSEPVVLNGQPAERKFTPADPADSQTHDKLTFGWEMDGFYFAITGILSENLDEASLEKMAGSTGTE